MDILYLALTLGFFALSFGFIALCGRMMRTGGKQK